MADMQKQNSDMMQQCAEMQRQNAEIQRQNAKAEADRQAEMARLMAMITSVTSAAQAKDAQIAEASRATEILRAEVREAQDDAHRGKVNFEEEARRRDEQSRSELLAQEAQIKADAETRHDRAM